MKHTTYMSPMPYAQLLPYLATLRSVLKKSKYQFVWGMIHACMYYQFNLELYFIFVSTSISETREELVANYRKWAIPKYPPIISKSKGGPGWVFPAGYTAEDLEKRQSYKSQVLQTSQPFGQIKKWLVSSRLASKSSKT